MKNEYADLRRAWAWTCPDCGEVNFVESEAKGTDEMTPEEQHDCAVVLGYIEAWQSLEDCPPGWGGEIMSQPEMVTCRGLSCDKNFKVRPTPRADDEEEERP